MTLGDQQKDEIIAAYAAGEDEAEIGRRYGLTREDVEDVVAEAALEDDDAQEPRRIPAPIVAAICITVIYGVVQVITTATNDYFSPVEAAVIAGVAVAVYGLVAIGIWRGWAAAQWIGAFGGAGAVVTGVLADSNGLLRILTGALYVGLLFVPEQSRDWFGRRD